jgi:hypothetical protein
LELRQHCRDVGDVEIRNGNRHKLQAGGTSCVGWP